MSSILYDANPSLIRSRPFGTLFASMLVIGGIWVALFGSQHLPPLPAELPVGALGLAMLAVGFLLLLYWLVATKTDHLAIRDDEILWTHGLLSKQYTEIQMASVRTVRVRQSLLQRILGAGDLTLYTAGDIPELVIRGLPDPHRIRELIKARSDPG